MVHRWNNKTRGRIVWAALVGIIVVGTAVLQTGRERPTDARAVDHRGAATRGTTASVAERSQRTEPEDFRILWQSPRHASRRPGRESARENGGGDIHGEIVLSQVAITATDLLVDLVYWSNTSGDPERTETHPTATLLANGCPASAPTVSGTVHLRGEPVDRLAIPLGALPEGELDLNLEIDGNLLTVYLVREQGVLRHGSLETRKGYTVTEGPEPRVTVAIYPCRRIP